LAFLADYRAVAFIFCKKRQRLAETPSRNNVTSGCHEKPACVKMNGKVIEAKPLLMPEGRSRMKKRNRAVDSRLTMKDHLNCWPRINTDET
jgi:hypothetical protein